MALLDLVRAKVKDDSGRLTDDDDYQPAVDAALARYSRHRPIDMAEDVAGTGTHDVALPAAWVEDFSQVRQVEFPVDLVPESLLDGDRWQVYRKPTGLVLRLLDEMPAVGESVRVTITVPRLDVQVAEADMDAVACLAASICCETLANLFASTNDPTIAADVVNYRTKSGEYGARGKRLRQLYLDHMGIGADGGVQAASVVASAPETARGRMTHGRWF